MTGQRVFCRSAVAASWIAILAIGCRHASTGTNVAEQSPPVAREVVVVPAQWQTWPETVHVQGSLLAYDDAVVGSKLSGRVESVAVDRGSLVNAGDPLVTLVRSELNLRVQLAEAQLHQACAAIGLTPQSDETQLKIATIPGVMMEQALVNEAQGNVDRARQLLAARAVPAGEYETLVAQLKAAQARYQAALNTATEQMYTIGVRRKELSLAQQMVTDAQVVAPFAGIIGERRVSPGEFVQAGSAVVTLVRADRLRFTAGVPERRAAALRCGQPVEIFQPGPGVPKLVTAISRISPTVMPTTRSILFEADVPNPELSLRAGLFAEAEVTIDPAARAVVVPLSAVSQFAGVQKVWRVVDHMCRQQTVRTGRADATRIEILDGLNEGNVVVRDAAHGYDGPVVAIPAPSESALQVQAPSVGHDRRATGTLESCGSRSPTCSG